jgi:hypothetical protein
MSVFSTSGDTGFGWGGGGDAQSHDCGKGLKVLKLALKLETPKREKKPHFENWILKI